MENSQINRRLAPIVVLLILLVGCESQHAPVAEDPPAAKEFPFPDVSEDSFFPVFKERLEKATGGDVDAQWGVGCAYAIGEGVPEDDIEAFAWFTIAASGQNNIGVMYRDLLIKEMSESEIAAGKQRAKELTQKHGLGDN